MYVVATAGHVDHGKSTLVRALTGMEPDRLAEEQRRGLTIDLGFAWTTLPSGREVAFVDVPGHERFLGNMLAGVGPAPAVCFVVAADQGWQAQSSDHLDAVVALGITAGLVVITRADLATADQLAATKTEIESRLGRTPLSNAPVLAVSAVNRTGWEHLLNTLDQVLAQVPEPDPEARVRLWIDRSFSIRGAGTVVTGTLTAGTLRRHDRLDLVGVDGRRPVRVRGLQSRNESVPLVTPHARAAVNLREVPAEAVHRGDALVSPDAWPIVTQFDVRRTTGAGFDDLPQQLMVHVGTAAVPARVRPFDHEHARLTLDRALPLQVDDRLVLRTPGGHVVLAGVLVLDVDPPALRRRGDGARRAVDLANRPVGGDPATEVARRGAMRPEQLWRFGLARLTAPPEGVAEKDGWWVDRAVLGAWAASLTRAVDRVHESEPLSPGLSDGAALDLLRHEDPPLPEAALLALVVRAAGLESVRGAVRRPGRPNDLGAAEAAIVQLEQRLREQPFAAPEAEELTALRLGPRELAAAERAGRLLRLDGAVVLLPQAPALAMRTLAGLTQPFTTSEARRAMNTTRRVAIPLLELLDARGWTRRLDGTLRTVVR